MAGGTWDDALEKKFLLELLVRGGQSGANMLAIAEKWGAPHTKASLGMKLMRMKEKYSKENDVEVNTTDATPKKAAGTKRKTVDDEGTGEDQDGEPEKKAKKPRGPKAKKVKAEENRE